MRALVFLLCLVLAFLVVLKFYPSAPLESLDEQVSEEVVQKDDAPVEGDEPAGKARFLEPPPALIEPQGEPAIDTIPPPAEVVVADDLPEWLAGIELAPVRDEGELVLAATLVHGTPAEVAARGASGPRERAILAEAFARAVAGDTRGGLSLAAELPEGSLNTRQKALLQAALEGRGSTVRPASAAREGPLVLAMEMKLLERQAEQELAARNYVRAAGSFSQLLLTEVDAPWPADHGTLRAWSDGLRRAQEHHRWNRKGDWPAVEMEVQSGDNLVAIRKRYLAQYPERYVCTGLIQAANQIPKNAVIHRGQTLRIPTDPARMLVDLSARWCFYFLGDEIAGSWPVGIGRPGEETPPGDFVIGDKIENPPWTRIGQEIIPFGDPRNPLGTRWMGWYRDGFKTSFGFHGTSEPDSIGQRSSDGCVRLLREDVERLFEILPIDTPVIVRE